MKKLSSLISIYILFSLQISSQPSRLYSKSEIIKDIDYLINDIEQIHPELYHALSKEAFLNKVQTIKDNMPESASKIEVWKRINVILASIKEGHSSFRPPAEEIGNFLKFPFIIKIDKSTHNFIVTGLVDGTSTEYIGQRIISINGIATDSLISIFKKNTSAENDSYLFYVNEEHLDYALYFIFGAPEYFDIKFLIDDKVVSYNCKSILNQVNATSPNYTFKKITENIGLIDMNKLSSLRDFMKFSRTTFKYLNENKISNLIVDFRGNTGGDSGIGDELIKYLSDVPFTQYQKAIVKVSSVSRELLHYPIEKDTLFEKDLSKDLIEPYSPNFRYSGKVFILIDGGTFSSAGSTVWCMKHYNLCTSIGEETGGTGVHFGYPIQRNLPITGLTYFISHMKWFQIGADSTSTYGLIPDHKVALSIEDIRNHKDTVLDYTIKLINNN